jgi:hypothetical protein
VIANTPNNENIKNKPDGLPFDNASTLLIPCCSANINASFKLIFSINASPFVANSFLIKSRIGEVTNAVYSRDPIKFAKNAPITPYKNPKPRYVAFLSGGAINPRYEIYLGCAVISPIEKTKSPATKIQILELNDHKNIPNVAIVKPTIIVDVGGVRSTILEIINCNNTIVPALITVTCSISKCQSNPIIPLTNLLNGVASTNTLTYQRTVKNI